jgi:hypothetical protein
LGISFLSSPHVSFHSPIRFANHAAAAPLAHLCHYVTRPFARHRGLVAALSPTHYRPTAEGYFLYFFVFSYSI